jgi:hypothetical protein
VLQGQNKVLKGQNKVLKGQSTCADSGLWLAVALANYSLSTNLEKVCVKGTVRLGHEGGD